MLYLTTSLETCSRKIIYPETASQLNRQQLRAVLAAVKFQAPETWTHLKLVQTLVDRVSLQFPPLYVLDDGKFMIFNSRGMTVTEDRVHYGAATEIRPVPDPLTCAGLWSKFSSYFHLTGAGQPQRQDELLVAQQKVVRLQGQVMDLKRQLETQVLSTRTEQEYLRKLEYFQAQMEEARQQYAECRQEQRSQAGQERDRQAWIAEIAEIRQSLQAQNLVSLQSSLARLRALENKMKEN